MKQLLLASIILIINNLVITRAYIIDKEVYDRKTSAPCLAQQYRLAANKWSANFFISAICRKRNIGNKNCEKNVNDGRLADLKPATCNRISGYAIIFTRELKEMTTMLCMQQHQ